MSEVLDELVEAEGVDLGEVWEALLVERLSTFVVRSKLVLCRTLPPLALFEHL